MQLKTIFISALVSCASPIFAEEVDNDELMWKSAYHGDFSVTHKLAISRSEENINDALLKLFVMAYVFYKMAKVDEMDSVFKGIDSYVEYTLIKKDL